MSKFLITGASKGIGLELLSALNQSGHQVWAFSRDAVALKNISVELEESGFYFSTGDVANVQDWRNLKAEMMAKDFEIDVLWLNAGVDSDNPVENYRTNFEGVKNGLEIFAEDLNQRSGKLAVTGSVFAFLNPPFALSYSSSKRMAWQFMTDLYKEKKYKNIKFKYYILGPVNSGRNFHPGLGWRSIFIPSAKNAAAYMISRIDNDKFTQFYPFSSKLLIIIRNLLPAIILDRLFILLKR